VADAAYHYVGEELDLFQHAANWKRYWSSKVRPYLQGKVLEVGAGIGANTSLLRNDRQTLWVAMEPDRDLLVRLRSRLAESALPDLPCEVVEGTLGTVDLGESFDAILYVDVLEHIEDDRGELERASRLLARQGTVIVLSPAHQSLYSEFDQAIGHFRRYNRRTLAAITPRNVRLERTFYLDSVGLLTSLGNRILLKRDMPTRRQLTVWDRYLVPLSRIVDPCVRFAFGKTIVGIWRR